MRISSCRQERVLVVTVTCLFLWLACVGVLRMTGPVHTAPFVQHPVRGRPFYGNGRDLMCVPAVDTSDVSEGSMYGRPVHEEKNIMFNSVPKCGSRTLVWVFWDFVRQYNTQEPVYIEYMLTTQDYDKSIAILKNHLAANVKPVFLHGHYRYVELPIEERPVFASMIREPLSRYISWYYFMRYGDADMNTTSLHKHLGPRSARPNETLDDCFHNDRADCREPFYYELNVRLFCGYDPKCDKDPKYALQKAKQHLENYTVIGLMEEYEDTVKVMEKLMPTMFGGAVRTYEEMLAKSAQDSKTFFKKHPSKEIEEYLKEKLKYDIEFYEYVKDRFHRLKEQLGIGSTSVC